MRPEHCHCYSWAHNSLWTTGTAASGGSYSTVQDVKQVMRTQRRVEMHPVENYQFTGPICEHADERFSFEAGCRDEMLSDSPHWWAHIHALFTKNMRSVFKVSPGNVTAPALIYRELVKINQCDHQCSFISLPLSPPLSLPLHPRYCWCCIWLLNNHMGWAF